jgi:hypothetical protein
MTSNNEEQANAEAAAAMQQPNAAKGARVAPRARRVAPAKPRSGREATLGRGRPKSQNSAWGSKSGAGVRKGSKTAKVLALLRRPDGATLKELRKVTGWQAHSVRGFLSAASKKMGLKLQSTKTEDRERSYSIKG